MVADISLVSARYDRERHLPLLLEADNSEQHVRVYLDRGQLLEICNAGGMIGVTVLVRDADEVEIWNIALSEGYRGRGLGRAAIGAIADRCRRDGALRRPDVTRLSLGLACCILLRPPCGTDRMSRVQFLCASDSLDSDKNADCAA